MRSKLIVVLVALTVAGPVAALAAATGGGGAGGFGGASGGGHASGSGSAHGGGGGGRGGGSAHGAGHGGAVISGYAIHVDAGRGGEGAPGLKALNHAAASATRARELARTANSPTRPKMRPVMAKKGCGDNGCARQPDTFDLYCSQYAEVAVSLASGCPGAVKTRLGNPVSIVR